MGRATNRRPESLRDDYGDDPRTHSELQLQAELHLTRWLRVGDLAVAAAAQIGVRVREVDTVQGVEHIRPQPDPRALLNPEIFSERDIPRLEVRSLNRADLRVAAARVGRRDERG